MHFLHFLFPDGPLEVTYLCTDPARRSRSTEDNQAASHSYICTAPRATRVSALRPSSRHHPSPLFTGTRSRHSCAPCFPPIDLSAPAVTAAFPATPARVGTGQDVEADATEPSPRQTAAKLLVAAGRAPPKSRALPHPDGRMRPEISPMPTSLAYRRASDCTCSRIINS